MAKGKQSALEALMASARARFAQIAAPDIGFDSFVALERSEAQRQAALAAGATKLYQPGLPTMTPCGGGNFDSGIDPMEWQGAHGKLPLPLTNPFGGFTEGLFPDAINAVDTVNGGGTAHQSAVTAPGTDPIVGIPLTAQGSTGAVRIGNAVNNFGCELLSKTFTVTAAKRVIKFWYAVVLQDPGHDPTIQPYFWVRVTETATGNPIAGAVDLGNGSDKVVSDSGNPFFSTQAGTPPGYSPADGTSIVFKDWSCAHINLAGHVGTTVTVEFVTADCGAGGHWGYAYVDNFCGDCAGSPEGDLNYNAKTSSGCGEGSLCFDYTLPVAKGPSGAPITGTLDLKLEIFQNGVTVATYNSPTLTSATEYCFAIDPATMSGLDPALGGFDFVATGDFRIGSTVLAPMIVGAAPDGFRPGANNDYQLVCQAFSYAVKFVCGTQPQCDCACAPVRPGSYATEINIYNQTNADVELVEYVIPVVFGGAAAGREPRTVTARAEDRITLPAYAATMDDCCRLAELLLGAPADGAAPLNIGYLEIVSPVEPPSPPSIRRPVSTAVRSASTSNRSTPSRGSRRYPRSRAENGTDASRPVRNGGLVPRRGLEPPRPCERQHLKLVRLPIPPSGHGVGGGALGGGPALVNAGLAELRRPRRKGAADDAEDGSAGDAVRRRRLRRPLRRAGLFRTGARVRIAEREPKRLSS